MHPECDLVSILGLPSAQHTREQSGTAAPMCRLHSSEAQQLARDERGLGAESLVAGAPSSAVVPCSSTSARGSGHTHAAVLPPDGHAHSALPRLRSSAPPRESRRTHDCCCAGQCVISDVTQQCSAEPCEGGAYWQWTQCTAAGAVTEEQGCPDGAPLDLVAPAARVPLRRQRKRSKRGGSTVCGWSALSPAIRLHGGARLLSRPAPAWRD